MGTFGDVGSVSCVLCPLNYLDSFVCCQSLSVMYLIATAQVTRFLSPGTTCPQTVLCHTLKWGPPLSLTHRADFWLLPSLKSPPHTPVFRFPLSLDGGFLPLFWSSFVGWVLGYHPYIHSFVLFPLGLYNLRHSMKHFERNKDENKILELWFGPCVKGLFPRVLLLGGTVNVQKEGLSGRP